MSRQQAKDPRIGVDAIYDDMEAMSAGVYQVFGERGQTTTFTRDAAFVPGSLNAYTWITGWSETSGDTVPDLGLLSGATWIFPHNTTWTAHYSLSSDSAGASGAGVRMMIGLLFAPFNPVPGSLSRLQGASGYTNASLLTNTASYTFTVTSAADAILFEVAALGASRTFGDGVVQFTRLR